MLQPTLSDEALLTDVGEGLLPERHDSVAVSYPMRLKLNGETTAQMEHAYAIKGCGGVSLNESDGDDTSKDQEWEYDLTRRGQCADRYVLITTFIWLGIKMLILAVPMLVAHLPPMAVARIYISVVPDNTERIHRSCCFYANFWLAIGISFVCPFAYAFGLSLIFKSVGYFGLAMICPVGLIFINLTLDYMAYYFFSVLYCLFTWRWSKMYVSARKIDPYRNGPSVVRHISDFFICIMGQCARASAGETTWMVCCMWLLIPWLKYYICCNPWIYDLDHRLCQQISTEMDDLGTPSEVADTCRGIISRARQARSLANRLDLWSFVPHYPYPPPSRRWALGLQRGGATFPGKFFLIVHTTHACSDAGGSSEQFVLSNSCAQPIYRVMLWYSNPFHFLTGWVEASVTTGEKSQLNKKHGGEHPMWLVTGRTPQVAGRDSFTGSGMIDAFFDYWLPVFVHEMRRLTFNARYLVEGMSEGDASKQALERADEKYQEVYSEDGVSRPRTFKGRVREGPRMDTLAEFEQVAEKRHRGAEGCVVGTVETLSRGVMGIGETRLGEQVSHLQQGRDLHQPGELLEFRMNPLDEHVLRGAGQTHTTTPPHHPVCVPSSGSASSSDPVGASSSSDPETAASFQPGPAVELARVSEVDIETTSSAESIHLER